MTKYRDIANALKTAKTVRYRDASNVLQTVKAISYRDSGNVLRTVYGLSSLIAVATPPNCTGYGYSAGSIRVTTNGSSVSVTGGSGSYTYAWTLPGGSGWGVISPSSYVTQFRSPPISPGDDSNETATCTVTDTATGSTATVTVALFASNTFNSLS